ncbi:MAG TPA: RraA family protein, partial [Limnochordia bacterium]
MADEISAEERAALLEAYAPLRVADVSDGMDWVRMPDVGLVSPAIRPLWRGFRMCGIARTVRYVPTNRVIPTMSPEEYDQAVAEWYRSVCTYPFGEHIQPGDVVVIDASDTDVGLLGSNNVLAYINKGARGLVTNGGCRDTDEVIRQKCPVFCRHISRTMVQGRLEFAAMDEPINVGGVLVRPGDVVVGDGDGVIV